MKNITEMLTATETTTAPVDKTTVSGPTVVETDESTPRTIYIFKFNYVDSELIVKYDEVNGRKGLHAKAHPALKVKPYMKQNITAEIVEDPSGYLLLTPCPTKKEIAEYEANKPQPKAEPEKNKLTKAQLAYLASFR